MCIWVIIQQRTHNSWQGASQNEKEYNAFIPFWAKIWRRKVHHVCLLLNSVWKWAPRHPQHGMVLSKVVLIFQSVQMTVFSIYWSRSVPIIITHSGVFFPRHVFNICFIKSSDSKTTMKVHMSMVNCLSYSFLVLNAVSGVYNSRQKSLFLLWRPPFFDFDAKKTLAEYLNAGSNDPIF